MRGQFKPNPQVAPYMDVIPGFLSGLNKRVAGYYYGILGGSTFNSTRLLVANYIYALPFIVLKEETFDRITINVTTLVNPSVARLGIYADNGSGSPGALLLDAGTVDSSTTGVKGIEITQPLVPGLYWLALLANAGITVTAYVSHIDLIGIGSPTFIAGNAVYYTPQAYGELPNQHPSVESTTMANVPAISLRRA
jgi:hypothetical protein